MGLLLLDRVKIFLRLAVCFAALFGSQPFASGTDLTPDFSDVKGYVNGVENDITDTGDFIDGDTTSVEGTITVSNSNQTQDLKCYYVVYRKNFGSPTESVEYDSSMEEGLTTVPKNDSADMEVDWCDGNAIVTHVIKIRVFDEYGTQVGNTKVYAFQEL